MTNQTGLKALTTFEEWAEVQQPLVSLPHLKLKYIGKQEFPGYPPERMWNINCFGHLFNHSTRTIEGLRELGIIR